MPAFCRDCLEDAGTAPRCPSCGSPRVIAHDELSTLSIAHMDCDAFYASVEKRDNPALGDKPVIVGGTGGRAVVAAACYVARIRGVHSAMPMFEARRLCPDAIVLPPRMKTYADIAQQIRAMMLDLTPAVEPLSLDEAFLDLRGTRRLHGEPPARLMARLVKRIEDELGLTASVGLSHNKFLAKIASDLDKPRGFSVIGEAEKALGGALGGALARDGIRTVADLRRREPAVLARRYGASGERLWLLAQGRDGRRVSPSAPIKSLSGETTFAEDTADVERLDGHVWRLSENVADRAKQKRLSGWTVTLKLKRANHRLLTRQTRLFAPTMSAECIYAAARGLLDGAIGEGPFRLIGVGLSHLDAGAGEAATLGDLFDPEARKRQSAERARDAIRERFGPDAIVKGRSLR